MNAYEFLDTAGEFFFDKTSKTLYYYKASSENMSTASVVAPNNVTTLIKVAGASTSNRARNITFSGLTVQHSDWNLFNVAGSVLKQAQQGNLGALAYAKQNFHAYSYRNVDTAPGIIQIDNADGLLLQNNRIQHTGVDGINMVNDVVNTQLIGNFTNDIAGSAITVGHPQHVYIGDHTSSNREKYTAAGRGRAQEHRDQEQLHLRQRGAVQRAQPHLGLLRRHAVRPAQPHREDAVVGCDARLGLVELRRVVGLDPAQPCRPPWRRTTPSATTTSSTRSSA